MYVYRNFYNAILESGMTLPEAAKAFHVSDRRLGAWLCGKAAIPFQAVMTAKQLFPGQSLDKLFEQNAGR